MGNLSLPITNVTWGPINVLLGYLLLRLGKPALRRTGTVETLLIGFAVTALLLTLAAPTVLRQYHALH